MQERRLRYTLDFAYNNTKFWHEWFEAAGIKPGEVRKLEDLGKLPVSTKKDILQKPLQDRLSCDPSSCVKMTTSGTTGGPMDVYYSKKFSKLIAYNLHFRIRNWVHSKFLRKSLTISFSSTANLPVEEKRSIGAENNAHPHARRKQALGLGSPILGPLINRVQNYAYVSSDISEVIPKLVEVNPYRITSNASYFRMLADYTRENEVRIRPERLWFIGEPVDEPGRLYVEQTLRAPAYQAYGCNQVGLIANECVEKNGMHVLSDFLVLEILDERGQPTALGERGEIVVTGLLNEAMPLIRYKVGDIGYMSTETSGCSCGRTLPILQSVEGRTVDHIKLPSGRVVSPKRILTLMHEIPDLPRSQLIQEAPLAFKLRVFSWITDQSNVAVGTFLSSLVSEIDEPNAKISVSFEEPDKLKAKFRAIISLVSANSPFQVIQSV